MGLGNDKKNFKYVSLRTMVKTGDVKVIDPAFILTEKVGESYVKSDPCNYIQGELVDIKKSSYEWEKRKVYQVELLIYDPEDGSTYKVEMGYGGLTRSILNSLISVPDYSDIKIRVYRYTRKTDGKEIAGAQVIFNYSRDPQKAEWAVDAEILKPYFKKTLVKGNEEWDSFDADEFLANMAIEQIIPKLKKASPTLPPGDSTFGPGEETDVLGDVRQERKDRTHNAGAQTQEGQGSNGDDGSDLPF